MEGSLWNVAMALSLAPKRGFPGGRPKPSIRGSHEGGRVVVGRGGGGSPFSLLFMNSWVVGATPRTSRPPLFSLQWPFRTLPKRLITQSSHQRKLHFCALKSELSFGSIVIYGL